MTKTAKCGNGFFVMFMAILLATALSPLSGTAGETAAFTEAFEIIAAEDIDEPGYPLDSTTHYP